MDENNIIMGKTGGGIWRDALHIKIFYKWSSENRFFQSSYLLVENDAIMGRFDKSLIIRNL